MRSDPTLIGIVDSGCRPHQRSRVWRSMGFDLLDGGLQSGAAGDDLLGHGSDLLEVIGALAPTARFALARVFHRRPATSATQVAAALDWLVDCGVGVVNLSLGLPRDRPVLAAACARALKAGVVLCAATPARGVPVYPAAYPGVLRATGDARCQREEVSYLATRYADFGGHVRLLHGGMTGAGSSVGCAHVCGLLARHLHAADEPGPDAARRWLAGRASYVGPERRVG